MESFIGSSLFNSRGDTSGCMAVTFTLLSGCFIGYNDTMDEREHSRDTMKAEEKKVAADNQASPPLTLSELDSVHDGAEVKVAGWVRSKRETKRVCFIVISDGGVSTLQVVVEIDGGSGAGEGSGNSPSPQGQPHEWQRLVSKISTGASLVVLGTLVHTPHRPQRYELKAADITLYGEAGNADYPLQKKEHGSEFLRTVPHLRVRTALYGAISRVRSSLSYIIHHFFHTEGFTYLHSPIITTHDAEGAGEMFNVSHSQTPKDHFFGSPAYLTVSGQLNAESYALAMRNVYTFGPTFRAEDSHTSRHLSEFWMVEPEMAFCDLGQLVVFAERCVKTIVSTVVEMCEAELAHLCAQNPTLATTLERLQGRYQCIEYSEAISLLKQAKEPFTYPIEWGVDLQSEHEKWLLNHMNQTPLFIVNHPRTLKAFYMRCNDDQRTVAAVDLIVPEVGELVGGSQREERETLLITRMNECNIDPTHYQWYLDLRRYGGAPHAGFGIGFDRLVQLICGVKNIRDVVAFPRTPGQAYC